jgi:D-3-phosphoglycerate dehydrogenase
MTIKLLIADTFSSRHLQALQSLGCEVDYQPELKAESLPQVIGQYQALIVRGKQVSATAIAAADRLAIILRAGAGVNTIDVAAASARGIFVSNCPGRNSIAVAELVFALLLAIDRRIPDNVAALRAHQWNKKEFSKADGLYGRSLGVVGVGSIGREVIRRARAFGMPVWAWSRSLTVDTAEQLDARFCPDLDELLEQVDVASLHVALTPQTRGLIDSRRLQRMKPRAILINTSRGEIVDMTALREAVAGGRIRAGLDVFDPEPTGGSGAFADPILDLPHLYGTHHIGASTEQAQEAIADEAVRIVSHYLRCGMVLNCVNLASRTPASFQLIVRHYDRVGVLAFVMDQIRRANINVEEVQNVIFDGATAASCRIQLDAEPTSDLLQTIRQGNADIIQLELVRLNP